MLSCRARNSRVLGRTMSAWWPVSDFGCELSYSGKQLFGDVEDVRGDKELGFKGDSGYLSLNRLREYLLQPAR